MKARIRVGQGFDIHRLVPDQPFKLGGMLIEWPQGPLGHSDGDVVLHALIDALLGAAGLGDIGEWFPPSDPKWKDADSAELLNIVIRDLYQRQWQIANVDITIFLEAPQLTSYKEAIQSRLATLMDIPPGNIAIKAKTTEGLGAIGKKEAVGAIACVLLQGNDSDL